MHISCSFFVIAHLTCKIKITHGVCMRVCVIHMTSQEYMSPVEWAGTIAH